MYICFDNEYIYSIYLMVVLHHVVNNNSLKRVYVAYIKPLHTFNEGMQKSIDRTMLMQ